MQALVQRLTGFWVLVFVSIQGVEGMRIGSALAGLEVEERKLKAEGFGFSIQGSEFSVQTGRSFKSMGFWRVRVR